MNPRLGLEGNLNLAGSVIMWPGRAGGRALFGMQVLCNQLEWRMFEV